MKDRIVGENEESDQKERKGPDFNPNASGQKRPGRDAWRDPPPQFYEPEGPFLQFT
jgi:hypothetical protein